MTPNIVYLHSHDTDVDPLREAIFAEMNDHLAYKLKRAVRARDALLTTASSGAR